MSFLKEELEIFEIINEIRQEYESSSMSCLVGEIRDRLEKKGRKASYRVINNAIEKAKIEKKGELVPVLNHITEVRKRRYVGYVEDWDNFFSTIHGLPLLRLYKMKLSDVVEEGS